MSSVFVSYRRADAQGWAGRLGADLAAAFGDVARFFDLSSIPPGVDFLLAIERSLIDACAVLVLIGPRWLDLRDEQGRRRLDDPDDVVAAEVAKALSLSVPVIPVLLGGAAMPAAADLPEPLRALRRRNGFELSDLRWEFDRDRLFAAIEAATPLRRRAVAAPAAGVSVGAGLELRDAEVGRITGVRGAVPAAVEVLKGAKLTGGKIGDITGVEIAPDADRKA
jgi:TIR domain-containing protein